MIISLAAALVCAFYLGDAQQTKKQKNLFDWNNNFDPEHQPVNNPNAKKLPLIMVKGNKFVNVLGDTILFRGVAVADPDKLEQEGKWNRNLFVKLKEYGATLVRIPVHPVPWRMRTPLKYLPLLDQAVDWSTELGMYVIIDWHCIGNLGMELFQNPEYVTTKQETYEFWRTIALHFRGNNTVAFYELFNEPTLFNGQLGSMSWSEWKKINEKMIRLVRSYDRERIPLVAGLDWAYDLTPLHIEPIEAEGIGYVTHPYPYKRSKPYVPKWDEDFGFAAGQYPVMATEFSFGLGSMGLADNGEYGNEIISYLESKGISWVCWIFDPLWKPNLLQSWENFTLTESGEFFKQALAGKSWEKK
ncbi:MAG: glycoside hydrolase family 5 protein [Ignavibacteriae bacterium]|nr:MAG: glycoside hydrolase family 5 protein [Ignavibacteriota bacterium]